MSAYNALFFGLLKRDKLPLPVPELRFAPPRRFRFDYAWPSEKVALEVDGGVWTQGRHTRGAGFLRDAEKFNIAACMGWRVLRVTPSKLTDLETIALIRSALRPSTEIR